MRIRAAPRLAPRRSLLPAGRSIHTSQNRPNPGTWRRNSIAPGGGSGRVRVFSRGLAEAEWTCPVPPAATLGHSLALPPLLPALAFCWRKISTNRLFSMKISTHMDLRSRIIDMRQEIKGKYYSLAIFLKPSRILKSLYLKSIPLLHRDSPSLGWARGKRQPLAFIMEAKEGIVHATVAGNGGAGAVADADSTNTVPRFSKRGAQGSRVPETCQASSRAPSEGL
ncbi:hypothetical protein HJG60_011544 [Phyllostomus discolor]|uniref:Uncharacterized protein n=1 Tax=Phyllostomus discolor TaxID=89673 RepID=A0A833ZNR4_9CHIR|nr:hypothetical protein HJG60_011544 [Phyllostomus discolor]